MKPRIAYQPGQSFLHRTHPLVKGAWLLFGSIAVFILHDPWIVLALLAATIAAFPLNRLRLGRIRGMRLFTVTALLLALLQILFVSTGDVLFRLGPLAPTTDGVKMGLYVAARFLIVILLSFLFVLTTEPSDLAYAFMRAGLPYRYGFALITAMRLIAVFEEEGQIVYHAQLARGVQYDVRSPRRFITLARQFFFPLLVSALSKVDALAVSMEGRCFGKYPNRTFLRRVHFTRRDTTLTVLLALAIAATVASRWL